MEELDSSQVEVVWPNLVGGDSRRFGRRRFGLDVSDADVSDADRSDADGSDAKSLTMLRRMDNV